MGLVLGEHAHAPYAGVEAVGERKIDDTELAAKRNCRLGAPISELFQPGAAAAGKDEGQCVSGQTADKSLRML